MSGRCGRLLVPAGKAIGYSLVTGDSIAIDKLARSSCGCALNRVILDLNKPVEEKTMISLLPIRQQKAVKTLTMQITVWFLSNLWRVTRCGSKSLASLARQGLTWSKTSALGDTFKRRIDNRQQAKLRQEQKDHNVNWDYQAAEVALDDYQTDAGNFNQLNSQLKQKTGWIALVLGARGSGKTALALRLAENQQAQKPQPVYAMGIKRQTLPHWIQAIDSIDQIKANHAWVIVDETGLHFEARQYQSSSNQLLGELLFICRHRDLNILFISQNSSNMDINILRQADMLWLKTPGFLQSRFERSSLGEFFDRSREAFSHLKDEHVEDDRQLCYVFSECYEGVVGNTLPGFWSDAVSKSYA
jgi:hypothetical protein